VETLAAYLRNGGNAAITARELHIHYNTLRYRLGKIDELTGGLDRSAISRLSLEVALVGRSLLLPHGHGSRPPDSPSADRPADARVTRAGCRSGRAGGDRSSRRRSTSTR
jgi:purine catabolism regulator